MPKRWCPWCSGDDADGGDAETGGGDAEEMRDNFSNENLPTVYRWDAIAKASETQTLYIAAFRTVPT